MKQLIENIKQQQLSESKQTNQIKWEILKYSDMVKHELRVTSDEL